MSLRKSIVIHSQEIFALGLKHVLETEFRFSTALYFLDSKDAVSYFQAGGEADLVLLEQALKEKDGFDFFDQMRSPGLRQRTLLISKDGSPWNININQRHLSLSFLKPDSSLQQVKYAIDSVLGGQKPESNTEIHLPESVQHTGMKAIFKKYKLSSSEVRILEQFLEQKDYKQVAEALFLSPQTIRTHKKNIYRKFGVRNMAGIVRLLAEDIP